MTGQGYPVVTVTELEFLFFVISTLTHSYRGIIHHCMIEEERSLTNMTISQESAAFHLSDQDENVPHKGRKKESNPLQ